MEKIKKSKFERMILVIVGIISFYYYYSTLVTTNLYYVLIVFISFVVYYVCQIKRKVGVKLMLIETLKLSLIAYFILFSILFVFKRQKEVESFRVPLNGYYRSKIDGVSFTFHNSKFDRKLNLSKYITDDLKEKYEVELELQQPICKIYFIRNLNLVEKKNVKAVSK